MPLKGIVPGPAQEIGTLVAKCDKQWTIQVKDGNLEDADPLAYTAVTVTVGGVVQPVVETDENGYITLVFTRDTDVSAVIVQVVDNQYSWSGTTQHPEGSGKEYSSEVLLTGTWSLSVVVHDIRPQGVPGAPIALRSIRIQLAPNDYPDAETTDAGDAWEQDDLKCETAYKISVPATRGAIATESTVVVNVNGNPVANIDVSTQTADDVKVRRTNSNDVTVTAMPNGSQVEVEFQLRFRTVFVVGEGPAFPYAIQLANRFGTGQAPRYLVTTEIRAPATQLAAERKWVIASQFDVHAPPGSLPGNLFVYRDPVRTDEVGRFDVRDTGCWTRLTATHGEVDAMVFNNPHPGFGMHFCEVKGLRHLDPENRYISVHSIGWDQRLDRAGLDTFRGLENNGQAAVQKEFLNGNGCNQDGTGVVHDWLDNGTLPAVTIPTAFAVGQADQTAIAFNQRVTHYATRRGTMGLWFSVLRCYCRNGAAALKSGGEMYVNGSTAFQSAVERGHLLNFEAGVLWSTGTYYANYQTNFTSDTFHPSWFADQEWTPGEPNLARANYYRWVKP
jgi:hypothetical protein